MAILFHRRGIMRIERVEIQNFRLIQDVSLRLEAETILDHLVTARRAYYSFSSVQVTISALSFSSAHILCNLVFYASSSPMRTINDMSMLSHTWSATFRVVP